LGSQQPRTASEKILAGCCSRRDQAGIGTGLKTDTLSMTFACHAPRHWKADLMTLHGMSWDPLRRKERQ
jgi:hypothetical protein